MAYGTEAGVDALLPHVGLDDLSTPHAAEVAAWLGEGAAKINVALSAAGWIVPTDDTVDVWPALASLNNLYAAAYALRARGLDSVVGETEVRSDIWLREFRAELTALVGSDLTGMGVGARPSSSISRRGMRTRQMRRVDGYSKYTGTEYTLAEGVTE